ncbi:MAG: glucose-1-phosphate cytidylyltransferase [Deltaproteobacteria bacterium]|nr:glucose-1-phosphate cytidylyltransferase [Deltaproteobacteria bacterium]
MKVVILAGGRGTRISEETSTRPKPMIEVGGQPLLVHIMRRFAKFGYKDFVIACGYKAELIKQYFHDLSLHQGDFVVDFRSGAIEVLNPPRLDWRVALIDTGLDTMTGGRLARLSTHLKETFMMTYGDGVADIDLAALLAFHRNHGKKATVTAVRPPARFGSLVLSGSGEDEEGRRVVEFVEKPQAGEGWINGGFFVLEPSVLELIDADATAFEQQPLERLSASGELMAYLHRGFWQPVDTLRDKMRLEALWSDGSPPWV